MDQSTRDLLLEQVDGLRLQVRQLSDAYAERGIERDNALAWARLWKRAALINRLDERRYRPFYWVRQDALDAVRAEYRGWQAQARALGLPDGH